MSSVNKVKGVCIGAGYFAPFQYEAWARIPEVKIAAACDRVETKARELVRRYAIPRYYVDWKHMIEEEKPDFVDIITPPDTHEEMCAFAAARGVHIICQKPLALNLEAGRRIVMNAKDARVRLMVHENWRWQPWYRKIKEISTEGAIGSFRHIHFLMRLGDGWGEHPYSPRQAYFCDYPRLLVFETGSHFIDTFRFLLGDVCSVYAKLCRLNPSIRGEDSAQVLLNFESGATAIWDANRYNEVETRSPRFTFGQLRIDGTLGHVSMDLESNIRLKRLGQPSEIVEYRRTDKNFGGDCVYFLQRHFVDCFINGKEFESEGEDYLKTFEVVEAIYASNTTSGVIRLPALNVHAQRSGC